MHDKFYVATVENVEVTYINTTAVNVSWTHPTSNIEEYTVFYTTLAITTQEIYRTIQNASFTGTYGVITGLDEGIGYEFLVVIRNESQCDSLDIRTVHTCPDLPTAEITTSEGNGSMLEYGGRERPFGTRTVAHSIAENVTLSFIGLLSWEGLLGIS